MSHHLAFPELSIPESKVLINLLDPGCFLQVSSHLSITTLTIVPSTFSWAPALPEDAFFYVSPEAHRYGHLH